MLHSIDGGDRGSYVQLCVAGALAYCSYAMCRSPVLPLFAQQLGAGPQAVGFVVGASTLTGVLVKMPAGALSDVFGRRALLLAGALVFAALPFAYLSVATLTGLMLLRLAHGNATAIFGPVSSATLSDLASPDRRGRWLGTYVTVQGLGQAAGSVLAGYLIAQGSFDRAFIVSGCVGVVGLIVLARWPRDARTSQDTAWWQRAAQGIREVGADRRILTTSLAQAGQYFVNGTSNAFLPLFAQTALRLSAADIGIVFGAQTIVTIVVRPLFGALSDRVGRRALIGAGLLTCGLAMIAIAAATGFATLLLAASVYGMGLALTTAATGAYITDLTRRGRYGAAHGVFGTIYDIGDAAGPIAAGFLVAAVGYAALFRVAAAVSILLAALFMWQSRRPSGPHTGAQLYCAD